MCDDLGSVWWPNGDVVSPATDPHGTEHVPHGDATSVKFDNRSTRGSRPANRFGDEVWPLRTRILGQAHPRRRYRPSPTALTDPRASPSRESPNLTTIHHQSSRKKKTSQSILIEKSLYVLPVHNPLRNFAIRVVYHRHFDKVIMGLIGLNCVFLAMDSKAPGFEDTTRGELIALAEPIFLALFCLEMSLKILACGFFGHENAYLSDGWNRLDFFVVILGVLAALDLGNFSAIRVVRVLRPLRTIQGFAGMRRLIEVRLVFPKSRHTA